MKPFGFLTRLFHRSPPPPLDPPVSFDENGFWRPGPNAFTVGWADVRRITGYKIDMFTWDEIRMNFDVATGMTVVVTEESPGFTEFMEEVERRFSSVNGWHSKISQPAFAPCTTVLYESPNQPVDRTAAPRSLDDGGGPRAALGHWRR